MPATGLGAVVAMKLREDLIPEPVETDRAEIRIEVSPMGVDGQDFDPDPVGAIG